MNRSKTFWWAPAILLLILTATATRSLAWKGDPFARVQVEILSDDRGTLTKYPADSGHSQILRSYIEARNDERYRVRVVNNSKERIGLVIAIDGRNIISGARSNLQANERMYILNPHRSGEFEGWRTGQNRVNRFYFTGMHDSYAAAWNDYSAMGVIAVAVFRSRNDMKLRRERNIKIRPGGPGTLFQHENPGTGFGEGGWSPSRTVKFVAQNQPVTREFIKYEWRSTLCRRGFLSCRDAERHTGRNRFWDRFSPDNDFAPFPPGRGIR